MLGKTYSGFRNHLSESGTTEQRVASRNDLKTNPNFYTLEVSKESQFKARKSRNFLARSVERPNQTTADYLKTQSGFRNMPVAALHTMMTPVSQNVFVSRFPSKKSKAHAFFNLTFCNQA